jgi:hypothetical protein
MFVADTYFHQKTGTGELEWALHWIIAKKVIVVKYQLHCHELPLIFICHGCGEMA